MAINKAIKAIKNHAMKRDETRQKKQRVMGIYPLMAINKDFTRYVPQNVPQTIIKLSQQGQYYKFNHEETLFRKCRYLNQY